MRERWRQAFHLEPPKGWLNDPNGLCWFRDRYHVFFQYCPDSAEGSGAKYWGHYESPDFLSWRFAGIALSPDTEEDRDGVYSGSAVPDGPVLRLYYTGNVKHSGDYDYVTSGRESHVIAVSTPDGKHMSVKYPLLDNADYPADCSLHVRDPKVWREGEEWNMVLGARSLDDRGRVLLYRGGGPKSWSLRAVVERREPFGYMWECPDYFRLDGRGVLSVSPQGLPHGEERFQNVYQSGWFPVSGPLENGELGDFTEWDMGFDFYAPQTFETPDGRRILIGWMGLPDCPYENLTAPLGWQHCLTVPRELFFDGEGRLCQRPVRELDALKRPAHPLEEENKTSLPFALRAEAEGDFSLELEGGPALRYDAGEGLCTLSFPEGSRSSGGRTIRRARLPRCRQIEVLADASSLEFYLDGGAVVLSTRFYPSAPELELRARGLRGALSPMNAMEVTGIGS